MIHRIYILFLLVISINAAAQPAFPGAEGFGADATGGRGGKVIYVTNLNVSGPGSLQDALDQDGPRYILFKTSGVIPGTIAVSPGHGDFTIAGQTSPGGIVVRGFEMYNGTEPSVSNIIIRHLRSRPGDRDLHPSPFWLAEDGITVGGVHRGIIDHCSFAHARDEAVDISRSSALTIQHCVLAETLGDHGYLGGMLINYSDQSSRLDSLSIHHNVWNRIGGRMPEISCETPFCSGKTIKIELSDNIFWDPQIELWYEGVTGFGSNFYLEMNAVNNLSVAANGYGNGMFHHDLLHFSQNKLYFSGNRLNLYPQLSDYQLFYCCNDFPENHPNTDNGIAMLRNSRHPFPAISYTPTSELRAHAAANAGAFPRDAMDSRLAGYLQNNQIIDLPVEAAAADDAFLLNPPAGVFADTDSDGMPDYWENTHGTNPAIQDHNGTNLSQSITGTNGYTNLECYLNCLSDALVNNQTTPACGIQAFTTGNADISSGGSTVSILQNPADEILTVVHVPAATDGNASLFDVNGRMVRSVTLERTGGLACLQAGELAEGIYLLEWNHGGSRGNIRVMILRGNN